MQFRSYTQRDFIRYVWKNNSLVGKDENEFFLENRSWVSRIIENKGVMVPFSNEIFDLKDFFDALRGRINILMKAFEINMEILEHAPLSASDQACILNAIQRSNEYVQIRPINSKNVRSTLWKKLQERYPENQWGTLAIIGVKSSGRSPKGSENKNVDHIISVLETTFQ